MLCLKVKLNLNNNQKHIIDTLSNEHRLLYNHLLGSIRTETKTFKELNQIYINYRINNQLTISSKSAQNTCISFINNIKSFYALHKKDITTKFPYKFKSWKEFTSFTYDWNNGCGGFKLINNDFENTLTVNLLSSADNAKKLIINLSKYCSKINDNNIKTLTFTKDEDNGDYYIVFVYGETESNKIINNDYLSIDLGYSQLVTCYSNKIDNFSVNNLKLKKLQNRIEYLQSYKDKYKKRSIKYNKLNKRFRQVKSKQVNKVKDFQHKVSSLIIAKCIENNIGNLIVGDLKVKKVQENKVKTIKKQIKEAKQQSKEQILKSLELKLEKEYKSNKKLSGISKSTLSIGRFKTFLEYKSKNAGIEYHSVNEAFTSQQNCLTDEIMFSSDLSNRSVEVSKGLFIDRDLNSAINIAKKVKVTWLDHFPNFDLDKMYLNIESGFLETIC